jgi:hypothetical protein
VPVIVDPLIVDPKLLRRNGPLLDPLGGGGLGGVGLGLGEGLGLPVTAMVIPCPRVMPDPNVIPDNDMCVYSIFSIYVLGL